MTALAISSIRTDGGTQPRDHNRLAEAVIRLKSREPTLGYVYCIRPLRGDRVKIGYSKAPIRRLAQLQTSSDELLVLECCLNAPRVMEGQIHQMFSEHRLVGEWFIFSKRIADWFEEAGAIFVGHFSNRLLDRRIARVGGAIAKSAGIRFLRKGEAA